METFNQYDLMGCLQCKYAFDCSDDTMCTFCGYCNPIGLETDAQAGAGGIKPVTDKMNKSHLPRVCNTFIHEARTHTPPTVTHNKTSYGTYCNDYDGVTSYCDFNDGIVPHQLYKMFHLH